MVAKIWVQVVDSRSIVLHVQRLVGMVMVVAILQMHHCVIRRVHQLRDACRAQHRQRLPKKDSQNDESTEVAAHGGILLSRSNLPTYRACNKVNT
nr:hypothetical protein [uncultured Albidiferax sp.]